MAQTPRIDRIDKNYQINGAMEYFQESGGSAVIVPSSYDYVSLDMFEMQQSNGWTNPESSRSDVKVGNRSRKSHLFSGTPAGLTSDFYKKTKIESILAMELVDDVFSIGFRYKSDNFTQVEITISYADSEDNFSSTTQIAQQTFDLVNDGSEQEIKFENILPNVNIANGFQIEYHFIGLETTDPTTLYTGEFIVNKGKVKNNYTPCGRDQIEEFYLCERYYELIYLSDQGAPTGASDIRRNNIFRTTKRVNPTVSVSYNYISNTSSGAIESITIRGFVFKFRATVGATDVSVNASGYADARL